MLDQLFGAITDTDRPRTWSGQGFHPDVISLHERLQIMHFDDLLQKSVIEGCALYVGSPYHAPESRAHMPAIDRYCFWLGAER